MEYCEEIFEITAFMSRPVGGNSPSIYCCSRSVQCMFTLSRPCVLTILMQSFRYLAILGYTEWGTQEQQTCGHRVLEVSNCHIHTNTVSLINTTSPALVSLRIAIVLPLSCPCKACAEVRCSRLPGSPLFPYPTPASVISFPSQALRLLALFRPRASRQIPNRIEEKRTKQQGSRV